MSLSSSDLEKLKILSQKIHWLKISPNGVPELYLDNHALQTFRMCEAYFVELFINHIGGEGRVWFLELGTAVHKMLEIYYNQRHSPSFSIPSWATVYGTRIWHALDMEYWATAPKEYDQKKYKTLGGLMGFIALMMQYATHFSVENERLRVLGAEIYFGKSKEVPLSVDELPFRLFLSGKIDILIDDGETICPMDHKTMNRFDGNPLIDYEIHDGMTGYVFAARKILEKYNQTNKTGGLPISPLARKPTNKILMNFISITSNERMSLSDRFKRFPLYKTEQQLEDYRLRQIRTASNIFDLLLSNFPSIVPTYDTSRCTNWMYSTCPYQNLHRVDSFAQEVIRKNNFIQIKEWNPEEPTKEDLKILESEKKLNATT